MSTRSNQKAIILLSSGLDSSVALLHAMETHEIVMALTFDYGQRAAQKEIAAARAIADHFGIRHRSLCIPWFAEFSASALLSANGLPRPGVEDLDKAAYSERSAKAVWVPNRNGVFIECAASFAEALNVPDLIVGFNSEEAVTFPDNSQEYIAAINLALSYSTMKRVKVISPTAPLNKKEIVQYAKEVNFPFKLLWSCYEGGEKMCGTCESCMRLKRGLVRNEIALEGLFQNTRI